jgi:DNA-binding NtrC family response regulator
MRVLFIDQDRGAIERLGVACLRQGIGVAFADTVCEGVRTLLQEDVSAIVIDGTLLHLAAREHARLFEGVAPGVPVVVSVHPEVPLETRVAIELQGFRVLPRPVACEDLMAKLDGMGVASERG